MTLLYLLHLFDGDISIFIYSMFQIPPSDTIADEERMASGGGGEGQPHLRVSAQSLNTSVR